jgi:hypothetical protein
MPGRMSTRPCSHSRLTGSARNTFPREAVTSLNANQVALRAPFSKARFAALFTTSVHIARRN